MISRRAASGYRRAGSLQDREFASEMNNYLFVDPGLNLSEIAEQAFLIRSPIPVKMFSILLWEDDHKAP